MNETDPLVARIRSELERQRGELDAATRSRLSQARSAALDEIGGRRSRSRLFRWPALACSLALAVAAGLWLGTPDPVVSIPATDSAGVADLEVLIEAEELELLADLEFYLWLETALPQADAG